MNFTKQIKEIPVVGLKTLSDPKSLKNLEWKGEAKNRMLSCSRVYHSEIAKYIKQVSTLQDLLHKVDCVYKEGNGFLVFWHWFCHWYSSKLE